MSIYTPPLMKVKEMNADYLRQVSCEEIQLVRKQANSGTSQSDVSFNLKLPDPSAMLHSVIWIRMKARFRMGGPVSNAGTDRASWQSYPSNYYAIDKVSDNIMFPAGVAPL